jgi:hypothetical protein
MCRKNCVYSLLLVSMSLRLNTVESNRLAHRPAVAGKIWPISSEISSADECVTSAAQTYFAVDMDHRGAPLWLMTMFVAPLVFRYCCHCRFNECNIVILDGCAHFLSNPFVQFGDLTVDVHHPRVRRPASKLSDCRVRIAHDF